MLELWWDEAIDEEGSEAEVCGPLESRREIEHGVFLNLGHDYPHPDRFTIVVWGAETTDLSPDAVVGSALCATGLISTYEGVARIELDSASEVRLMLQGDRENPPSQAADDLLYFDWATYPYQPLSPLPGEVWWEDAANLAGTAAMVCGPFADFTSRATDSALISLGNPHDDPSRFILATSGSTNVIDADGEYEMTVCGQGEIEIREGIPGMEIDSSDALFKAADGTLYPLLVD
ncbi:hypothetical protein [Nocardioides campestrisoli]|uniref:hypothetical protein n=1 Tax=Nocardioides campestrisoli TaxID=2736757 RepID=UPI00163D7CD4|nr:hypothetical protein [Nocardioides campestrisoli]